MVEKIEEFNINEPKFIKLVAEIREVWDEWDSSQGERNDDCLELTSFYNGFMAPYFGCATCEDTEQGLQVS